MGSAWRRGRALEARSEARLLGWVARGGKWLSIAAWLATWLAVGAAMVGGGVAVLFWNGGEWGGNAMAWLRGAMLLAISAPLALHEAIDDAAFAAAVKA